MRIALVSEHASPLAVPGELDAGGQNLYVADLSSALCDLGHEVIVYTRRDHPRRPERVRTRDGYQVVHVPAGPAKKIRRCESLAHTGDFVRFLSADWNTNRPDVVHAQGWLSGIAAVMSARNIPVPVVQTYHKLGAMNRRDHGEDDPGLAERIAVERLVGREASRVVATCSDETREVVRMGIDRSKLSVVPRGVDLDLFTPQGERAHRNHPRRIVSVGRLLPRKGFDDVISALSKVDNTELVIVGGPAEGGLRRDPEVRRLRALALELGVAKRVVFTGTVPRAELPVLLRSADVVACTPWRESFGIVSLEAMACAVPVVATDVGGLTDTVVHGLTGVQVPTRNPDALARALRALLADDTQRQQLGAAGYDRVHARYSWGRIAAELLRSYTAAGNPRWTARPVSGWVRPRRGAVR